jgi:hypothetical protein
MSQARHCLHGGWRADTRVAPRTNQRSIITPTFPCRNHARSLSTNAGTRTTLVVSLFCKFFAGTYSGVVSFQRLIPFSTNINDLRRTNTRAAANACVASVSGLYVVSYWTVGLLRPTCSFLHVPFKCISSRPPRYGVSIQTYNIQLQKPILLLCDGAGYTLNHSLHQSSSGLGNSLRKALCM